MLCDESTKFDRCMKKAVEFAEHATVLNPTRVDAFHLLGYLLVLSNDPHRGLGILEKAKLMNNLGASVILLEDLAKASIRTGNLNQSVLYVEEAFENGSRNMELKFSLASALANAGRVREASPYMRAALSRGHESGRSEWTAMANFADPPTQKDDEQQQCVVLNHDFYLHPDVKSCSEISTFESTSFIENQIPFKTNLSSSSLPSLSELLNEYGNVTLPVSHIHPNGRSTIVQNDVVIKPATTFARLQDFHQVASSTNCGESKFYIAQATLELYGTRELVNEFLSPIESVNQRNIWISRGGTKTPPHYDNYNNLLGVLEGTKHVLLFNASNRKNMYFTNRTCSVHTFESIIASLESHSNTGTELEPRYDFRRQSLVYDNKTKAKKYISNFAGVNVTSPNFDKHPRFSNVVPWFCRVDKGQMIYIPKGWPHAVFSTENRGSGWSYGVNWWF